jgi:steroid 5-alpha reductase family enzyme
MTQIFINCFLIILVFATIWFLIALYKKRNDVADIAWGIGYIIICIYLFITTGRWPVLLVLYSLVLVWGLRLSIHIYNRNKNKKEDYRYLAWRQEWGKNFFWRSYLQIFILQGVILLTILSPVIHAAASNPVSWSMFTWLGLCCWLIGFYFQATADYQLSVFIKKRKNNNEIIQTGLWKFSRHPNYFGEILMWWGIFIITLPLSGSVFFIISPLTIMLLLVFVSGIPLLEKKYKNNAAYEVYKKRTSMLFPLPLRKQGK